MQTVQTSVRTCRPSCHGAPSTATCQGAAWPLIRGRRIDSTPSLLASVLLSSPAARGHTQLQAAASAVDASSPSSTRSSRSNSISSSSGHGAEPDFEALLRWASDAVHAPCAHVQQLPDRGRGLVASMDVPPDGVILSVPFSRVFASRELPHEQQSQQQPTLESTRGSGEHQQQQEEQEEQALVQEEHAHMHWVADMAARLLLERQRCRQGSPDARWCTWLACLPTHVTTPLEFSDAELAACGDPALIADVEQLKTSLQAAHEVLQPQLSAADCGSWEDFMWAVQVLHSRCFFEPTSQQHLTVPGIDMANHTATPNAAVRIVHSPDAVQGSSAMEEVAAPSTSGAAAAGQSLFQLVAGEDGIEAGEEVTISYGGWPSDVFFLLFGCLPQVVHESQVLYTDLEDVSQHIKRYLLSRTDKGVAMQQQEQDQREEQQEHVAKRQHSTHADSHESSSSGRPSMTHDDAVWDQVADRMAATVADQTEQGVFQQGWERLVVTAEGFDARLGEALSLVLGAAAAEGLPAPALQEVLRHRLLELAGMLVRAQGGSLRKDDSSNFAQAREYAERKLRLLQPAMHSLGVEL